MGYNVVPVVGCLLLLLHWLLCIVQPEEGKKCSIFAFTVQFWCVVECEINSDHAAKCIWLNTHCSNRKNEMMDDEAAILALDGWRASKRARDTHTQKCGDGNKDEMND